MAGQLRSVVLAKGGGVFCLPQHIESFAAEGLGRLATAGHLRGRDRESFIDGLTQRAFCAQLARDAGHQLRWTAMDPRENTEASRTSLAGENQPLRAMLERLVDRPDPTATAPQPRHPTDG